MVLKPKATGRSQPLLLVVIAVIVVVVVILVVVVRSSWSISGSISITSFTPLIPPIDLSTRDMTRAKVLSASSPIIDEGHC